MLEAVLLDLDNTMVLFDEPVFYEHFFERIIPWFADIMPSDVFRERMLRSTMGLIDNDGQVSNREYFLDSFCGPDPARRDLIWKRFLAFYESEYDRIRVAVRVPAGLGELLDHLVAWNLKLVVASNPIFPQVAQRKRLHWGSIDSRRFALFTHIDNMNYVKPRTGYYRQICSLIHTPADRCLMIGNDPVNDMVAGEIGMRTFLTTEAGRIDYASLALTGRRTKPLPVPDHRGTLADVLAVVADWVGQ